ncbi:MAG TPA: sulfotransferase [Chthoniobacterales bacterium]|nr:sulfotransferase [Chthoniobacterales bacterium]
MLRRTRDAGGYKDFDAWTSSTSTSTITSKMSIFGLKRRSVERLDFIVPGAQKAGTTALHYFLSKHPRIALPDRQELHFFDDEQIFSQQTVDYELLHRHFGFVSDKAKAGEVTPSYLYWEPAMERIRNYNPQIKLIILLRNPIDRAFAHWNMQRFKDREPLDFRPALEEEPRRIAQSVSAGHSLGAGGSIESRRFAYVDRGFYSVQLERVFSFFPGPQVKLVKFENFRDRKQETLNDIFDFLGLKPLRRGTDKDRNVVPYERAMTADERKYLSEVYGAEITKLEGMLGWDLSDWR